MLLMTLAASSSNFELWKPSRVTTPRERSEFATASHSEMRYGAAKGMVVGYTEKLYSTKKSETGNRTKTGLGFIINSFRI